MSEQLSALMDGELAPDEMARQISTLKNDNALRQTWAAYHVLGDALRKSPQLSIDFSAKLARQLAEEPTVLAPQRKPRTSTPRYAMPLAASVAAVSLVGVLAWLTVRVNQTEAPIALAAAPVAAKTHETVQFARVVSNPYLLAHQEFSPSYAMEGIPAYVRTVSEHQESGR
ncbi:MAG: sigma-E factor negative regulatory protein [Hydrogenophilales bacterium]|nr:sigma-E factor negative regulatory protein [Hydrogenophilales bacterium]